jgi:hypothetical protein
MRVSVATVVMAGAVTVLLGLLPAPSIVALSAARVVFIAASGAATFIVTARALGISEFNRLTARYRSLLR